MPVSQVRKLIDRVQTTLHGMEMQVNVAYRTKYFRVERLAALLSQLVLDQTRSTVDIVRGLQTRKFAKEDNEVFVDQEEEKLRLALQELQQKYDDEHYGAVRRAKAEIETAILANLQDLRKAPWVHTEEGVAKLRYRFHAVLRDCMSAQECSQVMPLYRQMLQQHVTPDNTTFRFMILVCKNAVPPDPELAIELFSEMRHQAAISDRPTVQLYNMIIEACAASGAWRKALRMFKALVQDPAGLRPNASTYKALTKAARRANLDDAPAIYEAMRLNGVPEYVSYNAATRSFLPFAGESEYQQCGT